MSNQSEEIENLKEELLKEIASNYFNYDFLSYLNHCIEKWNEHDKKNNIIDTVINSVCKKYDIERTDLFKSNSPIDYYIRGGVLYMIKKKLDLSYGDIAVHFKRTKSYVFKIINDVDGLLNMKETSHNSLLKEVISLVEKEFEENYYNVNVR